jgi:hypothetical protein
LALLNNCELVLDHVSGFLFDEEFGRSFQLDKFRIPCRNATTRERLEPFGRVRRKLLRKFNSLIPLNYRNFYVQEGSKFDPRLLDLRPFSRLYLEGYWQSPEYFADIETQIRDDLSIIPPSDPVNLGLAEKIIESEAVAVHVRFFNDPKHSEGCISVNASRQYYEKAVEVIEKRVFDAHYFVFSDRPEAARELISVLDDRVTFVNHNYGDDNAYADLWLMSLCRHFVIANSTFSWWGAWLSNSYEKIVLAPRLDKSFGGGWDCPKLLPKTWIQI